MDRLLALLIATATAACAAATPSSPSPPAAAPAPPAIASKAGERSWDDSRIEALLAYHARVTGYRTMCWETRARRSVRCYDI